MKSVCSVKEQTLLSFDYISWLFTIYVKAALQEVYETVNRQIVPPYRYKHFAFRRKENVIRLGVYIPFCTGNV
jgi:hypothetical protein